MSFSPRSGLCYPSLRCPASGRSIPRACRSTSRPRRPRRAGTRTGTRLGVHAYDPVAAARGDLRRRHAAADRVGLAARRARLQLHADRRHRALPAHARAATSSTRWGGTTTGCRPSAASRTTSTSAAIRRAPLGAGLRLEPPTPAEAKGPPRVVSRPNFIELCLRAHPRGRGGLQGAVATHRSLGRLARGVLDHRRRAAATSRS